MILAINPLEHVLDTDIWHFFETTGRAIHLPWPLTKFVILELFAAAIICFFYIRLANRVRDGEPPKGWGWNLLDSLTAFVRDEVARPMLGDHDEDKYLPILWTLFLFIAVSNLLGVVPFMGSPTGNILVTGALALCAAVVIHGAPILKFGPWGYLKSYYPHIEAPFGMGVV